jgi:polyisoprenoid-binding protein YceI
MNRLAALALVLLAGPAFPAFGADWRMDPAGSRLEFIATFERAAAPGAFREFDARLRMVPDRPAEGRLDVTIATKSADMTSAEVNKAIAGAEWFDVARFPQAEFHAAEIRRADGGGYVARGMLRLKGAQQPVDVPFTFTQVGDSAQMDGEFTVKRAAFGIGTGEWAATNVIGADVKVRFSVRLRSGG